MTSFNEIPMFSKEEYDHWKIRMQTHLSAQNDTMWFVITDGPMKITKINILVAISKGAPQTVKNPKVEWTAEYKKKENVDNVDNDILYKT